MKIKYLILLTTTAYLFFMLGTLVAQPKEVEQSTTDILYEFNQDKMADLQATGYWSHANSDGTTWAERSEEFPLYGTLGENLYKGECSVINAIEMFKQSPSHLAILEGEYTHVVMTMEHNGQDCYAVLNTYDN